MRIMFIALILLLFFCEFLYYYLVINDCTWPEFLEKSNKSIVNNITKAMFLADTHLLGPYQGHWFDKLRREWQMYRAFQTAITLHQPEVVFILGDLFDEGQWSNDQQFDEYMKRYLSMFEVPAEIQIYVLPGNHDIGFHYVMVERPKLLRRFEKKFNYKNVQFLNIKGNFFVLLNSMAMEDGCQLCFEAEQSIKEIGDELKCIRDKKQCRRKMKLGNYSRPIVLLHFPMFRESDASCNESDEAPPNVKNQLFNEKWDCLSESASEKIYDCLDPRLIVSGHIHHGCHIVHRKDIHEYTLSSFNWRNKNNPAFMLAKITPTNYVVKKCEIPKESTVIRTYIWVIIIVIVWRKYPTISKLKRKFF